MKKLCSLLISFQLLIIPIPYGLAQTSPNDEATTKQYKQDIPDAGTNPQYEAQSQTKGGYDFYAKQILAASTSIIGSNIIEQCSFAPKVPSIVTFMAGSLVYILSEFAGAKAQNENHNRRIEDIKLVESQLKSQGGEIQKELITQRYKEEVALKDYLDARKKWMLAVTAIYWTAMGLAIMEESSAISAGAGAGSAACAGIAAQLAAPCGKAYKKCYRMHNAACRGLMPSGWATTRPNFANPAAYPISQSTCGSAGPYAGGCLAYTNAYHGIAWANCKPLALGGGIKGLLMSKALTGAYSVGLTRNSGSPITKYVVMMAGLLKFMVPSLQKLTMASYNYPIPRSVTFAVSAGLATAVTGGLIQRAGVAEENIKKLNKVVTQFKVETDDITVIENDSTRGQEDAPSQVDDMGKAHAPKLGSSSTSSSASSSSTFTTTNGQPLASGQQVKSVGTKIGPTKLSAIKSSFTNKNCLSQVGDETDYSAKACANPLKIEGARFSPGQNQVLVEGSRLSSDLAQSLIEGDIEKAEIIATDLNNKLANIKATTEALMIEKNEKIKEQGQEPDDFGLGMKNHISVLTNELFEAAKKENINLSPQEEAAIREQSLLAANVPTLIINDKMETLPVQDHQINKTTSAFQTGLFESGLDGSNDPSQPYGQSEEFLRAARANGFTEVNEKFKDNPPTEEGISSMVDLSLFRQVSNRYFLNYSRLKGRPQISE